MAEPEQTAEEFLERLFCDEYCAECGGDAEHHVVVSDFPFPGTYFAKCKFPPDDDGAFHPDISTFRKEQENA